MTQQIETSTTPEVQPIPLHRHCKFNDLKTFVSLNIPVYIHGPTGSGKTHGVEEVASALNLPFYRKVVSGQASEGVLFGFNNATAYVPGIAYNAYKDGGILLIDEIDNGNANINVCLKMLVEGDSCYFPCGLVQKHKDFRLIANANTIGTGANRQYVGRSAQDAALLNIFAFIQWDYDVIFEFKICLQEYLEHGGKEINKFKKFIAACWKFRRAIEVLSLRHIISPRNIKLGSRMLANNVPSALILNSVILRGLQEDQAKKFMEESKKQKLPSEQEKMTKQETEEEKAAQKVQTQFAQQAMTELEEIQTEEKIREHFETTMQSKTFEQTGEIENPSFKTLESLFTKNIDDTEDSNFEQAGF